MSDSNVVVITGANRGIGLELARHYAAEGCEVIGVCRQSSEELAGVAGQGTAWMSPPMPASIS